MAEHYDEWIVLVVYIKQNYAPISKSHGQVMPMFTQLFRELQDVSRPNHLLFMINMS